MKICMFNFPSLIMSSMSIPEVLVDAAAHSELGLLIRCDI